jgi:hypothetical protein
MRRPHISYYDRNIRKHFRIEFPTYRELQQNIIYHLERSYNDELECREVSVFRVRRGKWGEWYETWRMDGGKPSLVKEGWM